jgi:hypothetical protein
MTAAFSLDATEHPPSLEGATFLSSKPEVSVARGRTVPHNESSETT